MYSYILSIFDVFDFKGILYEIDGFIDTGIYVRLRCARNLIQFGPNQTGLNQLGPDKLGNGHRFSVSHSKRRAMRIHFPGRPIGPGILTETCGARIFGKSGMRKHHRTPGPGGIFAGA